jgi:hypothetical protein
VKANAQQQMIWKGRQTSGPTSPVAKLLTLSGIALVSVGMGNGAIEHVASLSTLLVRTAIRGAALQVSRLVVSTTFHWGNRSNSNNIRGSSPQVAGG